jgi:hypothetical protein
MEEKFLREEELKEDINWLFLANQNTCFINIFKALLFSIAFFIPIQKNIQGSGLRCLSSVTLTF